MHHPLKTLVSLAAAATLTAGLAGCQNDRDRVDAQTVDAGMNAGKLGGVPPETRNLILADLEGHQIESSEILTTATGPLYRVTYYDNGQARSKTYNRNGLAQALPSQRPANQQDTEPVDPNPTGDQGGARDIGSLQSEENNPPANQPTNPGGNPNNPQNSGGLGNVGGGGDLPD